MSLLFLVGENRMTLRRRTCKRCGLKEINKGKPFTSKFCPKCSRILNDKRKNNKKTLLRHDSQKKWAIIDDQGNIVARFRYKITAKLWIPNIRLNKYDKYKVKFVTPNS